MSRVVLPFSHGVGDESTFNYTKSVISGEETLLFTGKLSFYFLNYVMYFHRYWVYMYVCVC